MLYDMDEEKRKNAHLELIARCNIIPYTVS